MDKQYFVELLNKYLEGKTTEDENKFLFSYYELSGHQDNLEPFLNLDEKEQVKSQINKNIWQNITSQKQQKKNFLSVSKWYLTLAVAALIVTVCFTTFLLFYKSDSTKAVSLKRVNKAAENQLVKLQDGSSVILGPGSKLEYPASFDGLQKREVFLEGEAFFDISHNPAKKFIVHTGKLDVTVLGTGFNVKAIQGNEYITVTVKRGKVSISDNDKVLGLITKDEQIVYDKERGISEQKVVDADSNMVWKRQDIELENVSVGEAARILEDKFNVKILVTSPEIREERFTTVFMQDEKLEDVLKTICEFHGVYYEYNKAKATVTITKTKLN